MYVMYACMLCMHAYHVCIQCADALGHDCCEKIAIHLAGRDSSELKDHFASHDRPEQCYWICALCVNQHSSICGGFGPEPPQDSSDHAEWKTKTRDVVAQTTCVLCDCREPKFWNYSRDECELNKFDDVMEFMFRERPGF